LLESAARSKVTAYPETGARAFTNLDNAMPIL